MKYNLKINGIDKTNTMPESLLNPFAVASTTSNPRAKAWGSIAESPFVQGMVAKLPADTVIEVTAVSSKNVTTTARFTAGKLAAMLDVVRTVQAWSWDILTDGRVTESKSDSPVDVDSVLDSLLA